MPSFGSRWSGVPSRSVPGHIPWRSGSPQLVLGGVQALTAAVVPLFAEAADGDSAVEGHGYRASDGQETQKFRQSAKRNGRSHID